MTTYKPGANLGPKPTYEDSELLEIKGARVNPGQEAYGLLNSWTHQQMEKKIQIQIRTTFMNLLPCFCVCDPMSSILFFYKEMYSLPFSKEKMLP